MTLDVISGDRRRDRRYDLALELRYIYTDRRGVVQTGRGTITDLSRSGVRFQSDDVPPPPGTEVQLLVDWPFLLQNVCPLELVMHGRVSHTSDRGTIVKTRSYEFRTCGVRSFAEATAPRAMTLDLIS